MAENVVGIRNLKQNASKMMARVKKGESILVTDRGKPMGKIIPRSSSVLEDLIEAGLATPPTHSLSDIIEGALKTEPSDVPSSAILDELREDRL